MRIIGRFAVTSLILCLLSVSSAQSYFIRTEHNTNLRASSGLSARIVTTVRSGATLQVIGSQARWLRISRNGREVWMAEWVGHTRVPGADAPADIDNCCFVDRQCQSDQEWTNGYWAYQNNACPLSTQPEFETPTQTTGATQTQVDNCCFVDRHCLSEQDWVNGYWAYQNNQCGASAPSPEQSAAQAAVKLPGQVDNCCYVDRHCSSDQDWRNGWFAFQNQQCPAPGQYGNKHSVLVIGGAGFIRQMEESLDVLQRRAPDWYSYTVSGLARIIQRLESDIPGMDVSTRTFYLDYIDEDPPGYTHWQHISNTAAMLAHEACHQHRQDQGLESGGYPGEKACLALQIDVLNAINAPSFWINSYQHTLDNIDNPEYQWWLPGNY